MENLYQKHELVSRTYYKNSLIMASTFGSKSKYFMTMSIPSQDEPLTKRPLNDPRDFAKPIKAIALPQDVSSTSDRCLIELENQVQRLMKAHLAPMQSTQVNIITTSCEICSGPHGTQYCMEDPKQAFVEYASLRTDEAGGKWIEHKFTANAYIDVDLPMNIMSLAYYNSIRKNRYEYMGRNFIGLGRDMHVFVGNMSYIMDFTILDSIATNMDPSCQILGVIFDEKKLGSS
ncbi:hypothetical protein Tco_0503797 [Tanacetum coccineum]